MLNVFGRGEVPANNNDDGENVDTGDITVSIDGSFHDQYILGGENICSRKS